MTRSPLAMVVAMNAHRVIGVNGDLPWKISEDLRHFRRVTMGHAIIMGRKTWDSIGRPLPGRQNIIVTRNTSLTIPGCHVVHDLNTAISRARADGDIEPRIIGGASLYTAAMPLATRLFLTRVERDVQGDTFFPEWNEAEWSMISERAGDTPGVTFLELERA